MRISITLTVIALLTPAPALAQEPAAPLNIRSLAFSPDGKLLAAGFGEPKEAGRLVVWDVATRQVRWTHREKVGVPSVAFSPDGKMLAMGTFSDHARLLDPATGRVLATLPGHGEAARAVCFSPDGKTLATGGYDGQIRIWDVETRTSRTPWPGHLGKKVYRIIWSADGKLLLSAGEDCVRLWEVASRKALHDLVHRDSLSRIAFFSPDGKQVITGAYDGVVRAWSIESGEVQLRLVGSGGVDVMAFSPHLKRLAVAGFSREIRLLEFTAEAPSAVEQQRIDDLLVKLDDESYATREAASAELFKLGLVAEPALAKAARNAESVEVRIRARRIRQQLLGEPRGFLLGHDAAVESLAFAPDGVLLASGSKDGTVRLWDVAAGKELACLHSR